MTLGLSTQIELDFIVGRAASRKPRQPKKTAESLKPAEETTADIAAEAEETSKP